MTQFSILLAAAFSLIALPLAAASKLETHALYQIMRSQEILEAMVDEGRDFGDVVRDGMLDGGGGVAWTKRINRIYDFESVEAEFLDVYRDELAGADVGPLIAFFESDTGRKVAEAEVAGRQALADATVEAAAAEEFEALDPDSRRFELLTEFMELNSLVDYNVAGTMTSDLAFYRGLAAGGWINMSEAMMQAEIWEQEAEIRAESEAWVQAYLALAYAPLSDAELAEYVALSRTKPGRALNRAMFAGFYDVFSDLSYEMGEAVARFIATEDL